MPTSKNTSNHITDYLEVKLYLGNKTFRQTIFVHNGKPMWYRRIKDSKLNPKKQKDINIEKFFSEVRKEAYKIL